jgi:hypothetical protein
VGFYWDTTPNPVFGGFNEHGFLLSHTVKIRAARLPIRPAAARWIYFNLRRASADDRLRPRRQPSR